ncbi:hypothetical protein FVEN_g12889 [Fusarium venenatum]|uniref:Uncharacterized protein n=1 Tax=Fusarium venenatum TaxID=56646 RepID=A0A2L2TH89_9HYPO|nr:uncharacterized protein FVRRES_00289 [Fusarium venenatum]KAG8355298.1 hypothetical protein FVEN_g12889 [Fusarium venenatum]CEI63777.1 unnamed protein product [Fusarium venenatum]
MWFSDDDDDWYFPDDPDFYSFFTPSPDSSPHDTSDSDINTNTNTMPPHLCLIFHPRSSGRSPSPQFSIGAGLAILWKKRNCLFGG